MDAFTRSYGTCFVSQIHQKKGCQGNVGPEVKASLNRMMEGEFGTFHLFHSVQGMNFLCQGIGGIKHERYT